MKSSRRSVFISALICLFFFSGQVNSSTSGQNQSFKDVIILLVPGTGTTRKAYLDTPDKKQLQYQDKILKMLLEELKIDPNRIYSYSFSEQSGYSLKNILELGANDYQNEAAKRFSETGIDKIRDSVEYGTSQIKNAESAIREKVLESSNQYGGAYKSPLQLPKDLLPKRIITISLDDGADAIRGYIHSAELAAKGIIDDKNINDKLNQALKNKVQGLTQSKLGEIKKQVDSYWSYVQQAQAAWDRLNQSDLQQLSQANWLTAQAAIKLAIDDAKQIADAKLMEYGLQLQDVQGKTLSVIESQYNAQWLQLKRDTGRYWDQIRDYETAFYAIQNKELSSVQTEAARLLTSMQEFQFDRLKQDAVQYVQDQMAGFYTMPIEKAIFINPPFDDPLGKRYMMLTQMKELLSDIDKETWDMFFSSEKALVEMVEKFPKTIADLSSTSQEMSKLFGQLNTEVKGAQDFSNNTVKALHFAIDMLRGYVALQYKFKNTNGIDSFFNQADMIVNWNNVANLYAGLVKAKKDVLAVKGFIKNTTSVITSAETAKYNFNVKETMNELKNYFDKFNLANIWEELWRVLTKEAGNSPEKIIAKITETIQELGVAVDPVSMTNSYLKVMSEVVEKEELFRMAVQESFAQYATVKSLVERPGAALDMTKVLKEANLKSQSLPDEVLQAIRPQYYTLAVKQDVGIDLENTLTGTVAELGASVFSDSISSLMKDSFLSSYIKSPKDVYWMLLLMNGDFWSLNADAKFKSLVMSKMGGMYTHMGDMIHNLDYDFNQYPEFQQAGMKVQEIIRQTDDLAGFVSSTLPIAIGGQVAAEALINYFLPGLLAEPLIRGIVRLPVLGIMTADLLPRMGRSVQSMALGTVLDNTSQNGVNDAIKKMLYEPSDVILDAVYENVKEIPTAKVNSLKASSIERVKKIHPRTNFEEVPLVWPDYDVNDGWLVKGYSDTSSIQAASVPAASESSLQYFYKKPFRKAFIRSSEQGGFKAASVGALVPVSADTMATSANIIILRGTFSDLTPRTYANRTQAGKAAREYGGVVVQRGRPFFVRFAS